MRRSIAPYLLPVLLLSAACSRHDTGEQMVYSASDMDAAAAAQAAADAAGAAADAAADGNSAAALRQMGTDHPAREFTVALPTAIHAPPGSPPPSPSTRGRTPSEAMLAYEHDAQVRMDAEAIPMHVKAVREACEKAKYGACLVLDVTERGGRFPHASIRMRAEAKAIDPLIAAAGEGGEIGDRSTRAEDLSVAVRDNTLRQDRLRKEHARLLEFQGRSDLKVADMIALSEQLSNVEAELAQAEREGAEHQRRIETQLLSIEFSPPNGEAGRSEIADAFRESGHVMAGSTAFVIRAISALLPVLLVLAFGIWLLRRGWRFLRKRRRDAE